MGVNSDNLIIEGAAGAKLIRDPNGDSSAITINRGAVGTVIDGFEVTTNALNKGRLVRINGPNTTIRRCSIRGLREAIHLDQTSSPSHVLVQDVQTSIYSYSVMVAAGSNIVIDRLTAAQAPDEHCVRVGGSESFTLTRSDLNRPVPANRSVKTTLALQNTIGASITDNIFRSNPASMGAFDSRDGLVFVEGVKPKP